MSDRRTASSSRQKPKPSMPETESSDSDTSSLPGGVYYCSCGMPDAFENWICCDSDHCSVTWYHWECVGVTERPSGYWLCPKCSLKSPKNAEQLKEPRGEEESTSPMTAKRTLMFPKKAVNDENQGGHTAVSKTPIRPKKGIAVKKAPKKTKPRWVETDSEGEEGYEKGSKRAQRAGTVAKESQTKARATQTQGRLAKSGAIQKKSKTATGASKRVRFDIPEAFDEL